MKYALPQLFLTEILRLQNLQIVGMRNKTGVLPNICVMQNI